MLLPLLSTLALAGGRPRPELDPATLRWMREDACSPINLMTVLPDPATAGLLGLVGFGGGHFYAHRPELGAVFAAADLGAVGLVAAGTMKGVEQPLGEGVPLQLIGGVSLGVFSRLAQIVSAPMVARTERFNIFYDCGWED